MDFALCSYVCLYVVLVLLDIYDLQHTMSTVIGNWQAARSTIRERTHFLFNNSLLSDVKFIVPCCNGDCGPKSTREIPAHRFVLSISSAVFHAMFNGPMAETSDAILLPDCEYEGLLELFRYMYSDKVSLNRSNVMQVMYLAEKYIIPSLVHKCLEYLRENVDGSNVFCVLTHALRCYEQDGELMERCWNVVDEQTEPAIQSDGFVTIERSLLEALVERDSLSIKEIELFKAVDAWASYKCEKQGLKDSDDVSVKRNIIGERIVSNLRFPVMEEEEFASVVLDSNIILPQEAFDLTRYFYSASTPQGRFLATRRIGSLKHCPRFESVVKFGWICDMEKQLMTLCVDKAVKMHGVRLFGYESEQHFVTLRIEGPPSQSTKKFPAQKTGLFASMPFQYKRASFYGMDVLFDEPVALEENITYQLSVSVSGSCSWRGKNSLECIYCSGVTFKFSRKTTQQFPEILFTLT